MKKARIYKEYQDYIKHQKNKTTDPKRRKKWLNEEWDLKLNGFEKLFSKHSDIIKPGMKALCIGARTGQEVVALKQIGLDAIGIDIVEHPPNVISGDMHHLQFPDNTFDFVFSNVFDHSLYPDKKISEIERVLTHNGHVLLHFLTINSDHDEYSETFIESIERDVLTLFKRSLCVANRYINKNFAGMNYELVMKKMAFKDKNNNSIDIEISHGDYVIDCGANIGNVTETFLAYGANVIAFEPNPYAFKVLQDRFKNTKKVKCINKGVASKKDSGLKKLFLHSEADRDQITFSTGCSIISEKNNVNKKTYVEVEMVDLTGFLNLFKRKIKVLKIDIEGAEVDLLNDLMDSGVIKDIPYVFVETHEEKIPTLKKETDKLRERIAKEQYTNINLNWI